MWPLASVGWRNSSINPSIHDSCSLCYFRVLTSLLAVVFQIVSHFLSHLICCCETVHHMILHHPYINNRILAPCVCVMVIWSVFFLLASVLYSDSLRFLRRAHSTVMWLASRLNMQAIMIWLSFWNREPKAERRSGCQFGTSLEVISGSHGRAVSDVNPMYFWVRKDFSVKMPCCSIKVIAPHGVSRSSLLSQDWLDSVWTSGNAHLSEASGMPGHKPSTLNSLKV